MLLPLKWGFGLRDGALSYSFISQSPFTFLGLTFVSILLLSPLIGTSAKDNDVFHAIQHIPVVFFFSLFYLHLLKNSFSTRGSVCVHLLSFLTTPLLSSFTLHGLHLSCPGGCDTDLSPCPFIPHMMCTDFHEKKKIPFPPGWPGSKQTKIGAK